MKSGSLSLLEPLGPVQACNGIALPFTYILQNSIRLFTSKKCVFSYIRVLQHIRLFFSHYCLQLLKEGKCMRSFVTCKIFTHYS